MALDARTRSSIYQKLVPTLGEQDANALMSQFPAIEADELVTKQFLRAELAELRAEMSGLEGRLRIEMAEGFRRHTVGFGGAIAASTSLLAAIGLFT